MKSLAMIRFFKISALIIVAFSLIISCTKKGNYEEYRKVNPSGWQQDSVAVFKFDIQDTKSIYNISLNIRNSGEYPYSNVWMFIDISAPDNSSVKDTVEFQLALPNGKWIGKGTSGIYSCQFPYRNNVFFPVAGTYSLKIKHGMRNESLKGISDVGIRIDKR